MFGDLNEAAAYATAISAALLKLCSYVFLRWIPGHHLPPIVFALAAIYVPSFLYNFFQTSPYEALAEELDIVTRDVADAPEAAALLDSRYVDGDDVGEELDVETTIVLEEKEPRPLYTLLTGLPSPASLTWSIITMLLNLTLVAMVADLTYRGFIFHQAHDLSMARVGYVSDSRAHILVREPSGAHVALSYRFGDPPNSIQHGGRPQDTQWKLAGKASDFNNSTDFTATFTINSLQSDTRYEWATSHGHHGFFTTAPRPGHTSNRVGIAGTFTFLHSSCLKNNFPYSPFEHALSNAGLRQLGKMLYELRAQFMLFLGDFIYIDVPRRHGSTAEDYRREYRQIYASPDWPGATKELPWIHVYDDHELANDWDRNTSGWFPAAFDAYRHYHTSVNPPAVRHGESYFSFTQGPATFFMLDTRRYRTSNNAPDELDSTTGDATKSMLGHQQLEDLLDWLKRPEPAGVKWKILVSSVPFTKNWGASDTWSGFLSERQTILEAMWDVGLRGGVGVIVLSGDRHEFAATAFPPPPEGKDDVVGLGLIGLGANPLNPRGAVLSPDDSHVVRTKRKKWPLSATVHEFSTSPLNMFYLPIRTYRESSTSDDYASDVCIKYIPDGNSKFGAVTISNPPTSDQSVLHYRLFVDGLEAWSYTLTSPPNVGGGGRAKDAIWG